MNNTEIYYPLSISTLTTNEHNYFTDAFSEGIFNFQAAFSSSEKASNISNKALCVSKITSELSLIDRISHFALGLVLCIPLINMIAFAILVDDSDSDEQLQDLLASETLSGVDDLQNNNYSINPQDSTDLPKQISRVQITELKIRGLHEIPESLKLIKGVKTFEICQMNVTSFPAWMSAFNVLKTIKFTQNDNQTSIPEGTANLPVLEKIRFTKRWNGDSSNAPTGLKISYIDDTTKKRVETTIN